MLPLYLKKMLYIIYVVSTSLCLLCSSGETSLKYPKIDPNPPTLQKCIINISTIHIINSIYYLVLLFSNFYSLS